MSDTVKKTLKSAAKKPTPSAPNPLIALLAIASAAFAFLAFWDLALRQKDDVVGPKPVWIPVILVQWIGPASYFLFGIRR